MGGRRAVVEPSALSALGCAALADAARRRRKAATRVHGQNMRLQMHSRQVAKKTTSGFCMPASALGQRRMPVEKAARSR
jgi:hypothetical protein